MLYPFVLLLRTKFKSIIWNQIHAIIWTYILKFMNKIFIWHFDKIRVGTHDLLIRFTTAITISPERHLQLRRILIAGIYERWLCWKMNSVWVVGTNIGGRDTPPLLAGNLFLHSQVWLRQGATWWNFHCYIFQYNLGSTSVPFIPFIFWYTWTQFIDDLKPK